MSESTRSDLEALLRRIREPISFADAWFAVGRDLVVRDDVKWKDVLGLLNGSSDVVQEMLSILLFDEYARVARRRLPLSNDVNEWRSRLAQAGIDLDSALQAQKEPWIR